MNQSQINKIKNRMDKIDGGEDDDGMITVKIIQFRDWNDLDQEQEVERLTPDEFEKKYPNWDRNKQPIRVVWNAMTEEEAQAIRDQHNKIIDHGLKIRKENGR